MTASITLHQPRRLIVGAGTIGEVGNLVADATAALVIATPITAGFVDRLKLPGKIEIFDAIPGDPDVATLDAALAVARRIRPQVVVGLGGGSVLIPGGGTAAGEEKTKVKGTNAAPANNHGRHFDFSIFRIRQ